MKKTTYRILVKLKQFILVELFWMITKYLMANDKTGKFKPIRWITRKNLELLVNRLKVVKRDNSFANESAIIENILEKLNIETKFLVDIGAADGISQSSTALFLNEYSWDGVLFEYDADSFARLAFLYNDRPELILCKNKVTPLNIGGLLHNLSVPKNFGFLNIDIDSYDLSVLRKILETGFSPSVISMEINENFDVDFYFEVLWNEYHSWGSDHFYGCSLTAANSTLTEHGYVLVKMEFNNAIFVRETDASKFDLPSGLRQAYRDGYLDKENRKDLFPWNQDVEFMHFEISTQDKIERMNHMFSMYEGKYVLKDVSSEI